MSHANLDNQEADEAPFEDDAVLTAIGEHQPASVMEA